MVVAAVPAVTRDSATVVASRPSPKASHTAGQASSARAAPISRPVRISPQTSERIGTRDSDRPRTATASVWVPMASAR